LPLLERARVEVYLPDLPKVAYYNLLDELTREFTYTFGGCTTIHGLDGSYLSEAGSPVQDRINLIYTDTPYAFEENFETTSTYADKLLSVVNIALDEETVLIAVFRVYHAQN
jgi:hypothetical protein